jgi:serine/threonine-protein kinase RsbW
MTDAADLERFQRDDIPADAASVALTRDELAEWLKDHFDLDELRLNDIVLAVNEALANAAEFAYLQADQPGAVNLRAAYDAGAYALALIVIDEGVWREPDPRTQGRIRGRGIPLMQALADDARIETSALGTTVRLRFDNVDRVAVATSA